MSLLNDNTKRLRNVVTIHTGYDYVQKYAEIYLIIRRVELVIFSFKGGGGPSEI